MHRKQPACEGRRCAGREEQPRETLRESGRPQRCRQRYLQQCRCRGDGRGDPAASLGTKGAAGPPPPAGTPARPWHCQELKGLLYRTSQGLNIRQRRRLNRLFSSKSLHAAFEIPRPDSVVWFWFFKVISTNDFVVQEVCWASTSS